MSGQAFTKIQSEIAELIARSVIYELLAHVFRYPVPLRVRKWVEAHIEILRDAAECAGTQSKLNSSLRGSVPNKAEAICGSEIAEPVPRPEIVSPRFSAKGRIRRLCGEAGFAMTAEGSRRPPRNDVQKVFSSLLDEIEKTSDDNWIRQYEFCFGHTAHSKVPAYELEYGEEHSHRQPQELADITAFYRAFGLQASKQAHERVDHVSVECEFMYFLIFKETHALQEGQEEHASICKEARVSFLADHLGRWLPAFALRLSKFAGEGLMKLIADFAFLFLVSDCERIGVQAGPSDLPIRMIQEREETDCISCVAARAQMRENEITSNPI